MAGEAARRSDPKLSAVPTKRLYPSCKHPFRSSEGPPSLENNPLLTGEAKVVPPLVISEDTKHAMDRETTTSRGSPPRSPVRSPLVNSVQFATPRRAGSSSSLTVESARESPAASPRKEPIKRSLTMSASAANIAPLLSQMNVKFAKSIMDLPVASDIPRMVGRTTVFSTQTGDVLFNRAEGTVGQPKPANTIALSKAFILLLFSTYNTDNKRLVSIASEQFDEILPTDFEGDTRDRLHNYLESVVVNDNTVSAILKCINQGIVAPAIISLRIGLMGKLNYKDCGNNWDIEVRLNSNSVVVSHIKREVSVPGGCEFSWKVEMHLVAPFIQLINVDFSIVDVTFTDESMEMDRKIKIVEGLSSFFSPELRDKYATMSPSKIGKVPSSARDGPASPSSSSSSTNDFAVYVPSSPSSISAPAIDITDSPRNRSSQSPERG